MRCLSASEVVAESLVLLFFEERLDRSKLDTSILQSCLSLRLVFPVCFERVVLGFASGTVSTAKLDSEEVLFRRLVEKSDNERDDGGTEGLADRSTG